MLSIIIISCAHATLKNTNHSYCCIVVTRVEARLAASEEEQQRLLQEVEQWKKMFNDREIQISQLQNENKQLQDKCKYLQLSYY